MVHINSDVLSVVAVVLPLIPVVFILGWKLGLWGSNKKGSQAYDPKTGIGRGAPGFQTSVRRVAVPRSELHKYGLAPEDEARILAANGQKPASAASESSKKKDKEKPEDEWMPQGHARKAATTPSGQKSRKRK